MQIRGAVWHDAVHVPELGPRLRAIANYVLPSRPFADICCDHARLAAALVEAERVPWAVAGDCNGVPLASARSMLIERGLDDRVKLREGDGLAVLEPGEVASVVLAGIGATLAERIFRAGVAADRLRGVERLIVQPNHGYPRIGSLRATLHELGWGIVDESLVRDQGRMYVVLVAEPGVSGELDPRGRELGPILQRGEDPLWPDWLARERDRIERARDALARSGQEPDKLAGYDAYLALLKAR